MDALGRAVPRVGARPRDDRRRPRLDRRHPDLVREQHPDVQLVEQENLGLAAGGTAACASPHRPLVPHPQRRCLARGRRARAARGLRASRGRRRRSSGRGSATPTAVSSAPCAAFRRCGGSRPSTSSCASSRRGRSSLNAFYGSGFDHDSDARGGVRSMGAAMLVRRAAVDAGRPARRGLLPLQRGDRLVLPLPAGGLEGALLPGRGGLPRRRRVARRPAVPRARARPRPLHDEAPRGARRRAHRRLLRASLLLRGALFRGERGGQVPRGGALARHGHVRRSPVDAIERAEQPVGSGFATVVVPSRRPWRSVAARSGSAGASRDACRGGSLRRGCLRTA